MTMKKENKALRTHVLDELDWAPNVDAENIGVAVSDGVVTLSGSVPSYAEKRAAERAVLRVAGVKGIANDLTVRLPDKFERSDTDIAKAVRRAIEWHTQLPTDAITVKVEDGWVTLQGTVNRYSQTSLAERLVRDLMGVRGVRNELMVEKRPVPDDVHERIRTALERQAGVEADRIRITVDDGTVTLKGTVASWADREDVERAAWAAPGVTEVKNELTVDTEAYVY
jgi:osmotically-inducible protein OsmY